MLLHFKVWFKENLISVLRLENPEIANELLIRNG